jgi:hypothetical protein
MFTKISEDEFNKSNPIFRIIVHDYPRSFGSLRLPNASHELKLSWRSELIKPVIEPDSLSSTIWIAVDQRLAGISPQGNILFSLGLNTPILQIGFCDNCLIALCETEALAINHDYSLRRIYDFREIALSFDIKEGEFVVRFIDNEKEAFPI